MTAPRPLRGPTHHLLSLGIASALAALPAMPAAAQSVLPGGMSSSTNVGAPTTNGSTMTVDVTGPRAYAEWNTFSVGNGATFQVTNTTTPNGYIFVNRVTGGNFSSIDGRVAANGNFWLINPNGIAVGATGAFDVGGLLLSTATTLNGETEATNGAAFLAGATPDFSFGGGGSTAISIAPGARLTATAGAIALIANQVAVGGTLNAGSGDVAIVGGNGVSVGFDADLNSFATLSIDAGTTVGQAVVVNGAAQIGGARTVIAAAGMTDGQGNILLVDDNAANNISFSGGDVLLYAGRNGEASSVVQGGAFQQTLPLDGTGARIDAIGAISAPANLAVTAAGGIGRGGQDLNLAATGAVSIHGTARGRDVAVGAGQSVTLTAAEAQDDLVVRSNGITTLGPMSSGVTVDGLAATDAPGAGDALNGPTLSGNDMSLYGENGVVNMAVAPLVGGSYRVRGTDFMGAALAPTWRGGGFENTFVITDTAGGFTAGNLRSPGRLWIEVRNGGDLTVSGPLTSTRGDVQLITTGGGNIVLNGNVTSGVRAGSVNEHIVLNSTGAIVQNAGVLDTTLATGGGALHVRAANGISLMQANRFGNAAFVNTGTGGIHVRNASGSIGSAPFTLTTVNLADGFNPAIAGASTGSGDVEIVADNGMRVNGVAIGTGAGNVTVTGATRIAGASTVSAAGGAAVFNGTVDGDTAGAGNLVVNATNGTRFNGNVGAAAALATLAVNGGTTIGTGAGTVRAAGGIDLGDLTVDAGAPATVTLDAGSGTLATGAIVSNRSGTLVGRGAAIDVASFTGADSGLDLASSAGGLSLGAANVGGGATLAAAGGDLSIAGAVQAAGPVTLNASGAARAASLASTGGNVTVVSEGIDLGRADAAGILALNGGAGDIRLGGGSGNSVSLNTGGAIDVTGPLATRLLVGSAGGTATLAGANRIEELGNFSATGVTLNNTGGLRISGTVDARTGDASIGVTGGNLDIASTGQVRGAGVDLSTDAAFVNASGADAVVASRNWVVYSAAPAGNSFDNLDSGNTAVWNATRASLAPGSVSGNRYVFALSPTLTFTSTGTSKVYGTDLTGSTASLYAVSGLQSGVTGAFLGDTLASAFSGSPLVSSAGLDARASVAGGPYAVTLSNGTLSSASGYTFAFDNAGAITVTPKALTAVVTPTSKTYDGTTAATGTIALDGVVSGDTVGATGTFTFADANAGTGKQVNVSGVSLTGADAGNYTVVVSGSALADILQRAITVTANPLSKREGTADPALTYTITGGALVSGDTLGGALARAPGEAPGQYAIGQGTLSASSNYRLSFVGSTLTITPVDVGPTPDPTPAVTATEDLRGITNYLRRLGAGTTGELVVYDEREVCEPGRSQEDARCPQARN